ncbi:hypothetical protein R6Q59_027084 [Mikania micrantha]|uniref:FAF domain-containing protein n=1 Tax=Mikania micrantha TaxID=192012 RepID=A0A5N6MCG0_9ASTR|nr:hypothetical protein E3N88_33761 [Mikania micrantha]
MASIGLSFLQVLENPSMASKNLEENAEVYVHPMVKRSASTLSTKSLEMCTESLGSETGSDGSESGDEFCVISMAERERLRAIQRSKCRSFGRKVCRNDFPPPLTSIAGFHGAVNVKQHREGGRLIIKAVSFSNCGTSFQAERTNGRLKLSMLRDCPVNYESERGELENYEAGGEDHEVESDKEEEEEEEMVEAVAVAEEEEDGGTGGGWGWDMVENRWKIAGKSEVNLVTTCKEGENRNEGFPNWRSTWVGRVAIS